MPTPQAAPLFTDATDAFIERLLPGWLSLAGPPGCRDLREAYFEYRLSLTTVQQALAAMQAPEPFARVLLQQAIKLRLGLTVDLSRVIWRERRRVSTPPFLFITDFVHLPALQRLLGNFYQSEVFLNGSALVDAQSHKAITREMATIANLCRELDVGRQYQAHLAQVFSPSLIASLAEHKRRRFKLAFEVAKLRGAITAADGAMLAQLMAGAQMTHPLSRSVRCGFLQVLGYQITGALVFDLMGVWVPVPGLIDVPTSVGLVLFLPDEPEHALRRFDSWASLARWLGQSLADPQCRLRFMHAIAVQHRAAFSHALANRLNDKQVDPSPSSVACEGDVFIGLAQQFSRRVRNDAATLLVPTAEIDRVQMKLRHVALVEAASVLFSLVGGFVPGLNELLLAQMVGQTLAQVFEGVLSWSEGHQHEAFQHMLGVAENLAINAGLAAGGALLLQPFTRAARVDAMTPVLTDAGPRLWVEDLVRYRDALPATATLHDNGLYHHQDTWWWQYRDEFYRVEQREPERWQLSDEGSPGAYGPRLIHNGEHGWRLFDQRPLEWQAADEMLWSLWPASRQWGPEKARQVLQVAGYDASQLRGLWVERRALPFDLRDTLERFAVERRIERAFQALSDGPAAVEPAFTPVLQRLGVASAPPEQQLIRLRQCESAVRAWLFESALAEADPLDSSLSLVLRDFPGLAHAYAREVVSSASDLQRLHMREHQRLPLPLAEHARSLLQQQRVSRMIEALYLPVGYTQDGMELIFALLRRHAYWPAEANLDYRADSVFGPSLARIYPAQTPGTRIMVSSPGGVSLYDLDGRLLDDLTSEPMGMFEALLSILPDPHRQRLGWTAQQAAGQMRADLQRWLPDDRSKILELVGMRLQRPAFNPPQRHSGGRIGYALSGRARAVHPGERTVRDRLRALFPGLSDNEVDTYLLALRASQGSVYSALLEQEQALRSLEVSLRIWSETAGPAAAVGRRRVAEALRRCWQRTEVDGGVALHLTGTSLGQLPELPVQVQFPHVQALGLGSLGLTTLPVRFIERFANVRRLSLSHNRLTRVPPEVAHMRDLVELHLEANAITLNAEDVSALRDMRQLRALNLAGNPLGEVRLQVGRLFRLTTLQLRDCNLTSLPAGLVWCAALERADLRDNRISGLAAHVLQAPYEFRRALWLDRNPLALEIRQRLAAPREAPSAGQTAGVSQDRVRALWLERLDQSELRTRQECWQRLQAEPNSAAFFDLIGQLIDTRDFREARTVLEARLWTLMDAALEHTELREALFNLAAYERTCVDSVMNCFNALEVRAFIAQVVHDPAHRDQQEALLDAARRLFRIEQVEAFARQHMSTRADPSAVDEIETSLAFRIGLASRLKLPGQASLMQFEALAGVSAADLNSAYQAVLDAEQGDALVEYVSHRDFWIDHLRALHADAFAATEQPYWDELEALDDRQETLGALGYQREAEAVAARRALALQALTLRLTRNALGRT